ncbi:MAG: 2-succinyl-5-enolpyruvyl-6-hydroxy-3-cyclohexene-1-carboxylic-acid synthase [Candidatus Accumulibacter sp.]|uniref:2-succinyl-5-enolpyruvyl-6-hydroxy-3- cyclohexene-1-carboxylic-acid synthase n=1 Tax=Accumulibacter sp. TaxID=2053492 RepID=UPI001A5EB054|nr:2-succinyl-5-enolpyruvyl-6-hydroxy-3-cyclohexene-1-carboxylic-acid synthase [Accumulibacter sp.]MBL8393448.1 2-succinyl-5-enolpyruvyl-6-hydroxy-3-cyclohexene-1-carboxylic-acid synthase [Accumulibacter sp.]
MSATPDDGRLNLCWSQALVDGLAMAGLRELILSPGARSSPLALAFLRQPAIRCHVVLDERSAAFFALGVAKVSGFPAAVLCTSGSAPANWYPAVIEADYAGIPLLLLSADRPPELLGWGANQTIDQLQLFGRHVRAFFAPGPPGADFSVSQMQHLAARACRDSRWPSPGPVHLNLAFREPLLPSVAVAGPSTPPAAAVRLAAPLVQPDAPLVAHTAAAISRRRGVIVCGGADFSPPFAEAVTALAGQLDCPVFAEALSNLRFGKHDRSRLCVRYDAFLRQPGWLAGAQPEWVLRFGAFPLARSLQDWLNTLAGAQHMLVAPDHRWPDPLHRTATLIQADPLAVCTALLAAAPEPGPASWRASFARAEARVEAMAAGHRAHENSAAALIPALIEQLPAGHRLFCGNSLPIRELDAFSGSGDKPLRIFGNRGASGIDGNLSTALGIATEGPCLALLGDLTAQHDLTALAVAGGHDIIVLVINNGGGGIFEYLPMANLPEFERAWLTPQRLDFRAAAECFGLAYRRTCSLVELRAGLAQALQEGGPWLLELVLDRRVSVARQRAFWAAAAALVS